MLDLRPSWVTYGKDLVSNGPSPCKKKKNKLTGATDIKQPCSLGLTLGKGRKMSTWQGQGHQAPHHTHLIYYILPKVNPKVNPSALAGSPGTSQDFPPWEESTSHGQVLYRGSQLVEGQRKGG